MVIAATQLTPAASCSADVFRYGGGANNAAAGHGRRDFYSRPGRDLGLHFRRSPRKIRTYGRPYNKQNLPPRPRQSAFAAAGDAKRIGRPRTATSARARARYRRTTARWSPSGFACAAATVCRTTGPIRSQILRLLYTLQRSRGGAARLAGGGRRSGRSSRREGRRRATPPELLRLLAERDHFAADGTRQLPHSALQEQMDRQVRVPVQRRERPEQLL